MSYTYTRKLPVTLLPSHGTCNHGGGERHRVHVESKLLHVDVRRAIHARRVVILNRDKGDAHELERHAWVDRGDVCGHDAILANVDDSVLFHDRGVHHVSRPSRRVNLPRARLDRNALGS